MTKEETYRYLQDRGIAYEVTEHEAVFNMEELAEELLELMGLTPGAVTPLGLLHDPEHRVHLYLDAVFAGNKIGVHPNDNTATLWMQADDLVKLLREHGCAVDVVEV